MNQGFNGYRRERRQENNLIQFRPHPAQGCTESGPKFDFQSTQNDRHQPQDEVELLERLSP